jgi:methylthioribulose-1-phosphate dehydratase
MFEQEVFVPQEQTPQLEALVAVACMAAERGWATATSGNFSCRLSHDQFAITASGRDKGAVTVADLVVVALDGTPLVPDGPQPSAETAVHAGIYRLLPEIGTIVHTHSVPVTVLSQLRASQGAIELSGYEMLKALAGVGTHEHQERVPIFANTQEPATLVGELIRAREAGPLHGFLVERHGLYTWGRTTDEARRHLEALEFLLDCELRLLLATKGGA